MSTTILPPSPTRTSRWLVLALLATAQLMLVLDVTVVNVALPDIGRALGLGRDAVPWVLTTYTLVFGGLMLLGGRVADQFGARRSVLAGLAVFTAASLACGLADGAPLLLAGRAVQGVGAALLSPAALALVMAAFPGPDRGRALAVWSSLSGAGAALGVVLGGVLTSGAGWRWIFTVNVPIGVLLLLVLPVVAPTGGARVARRGLDLPGAALVTGGTAAAIYGLVNAGTHGWGTPSTLLPLLGSTVLWALFVSVERAVPEPLLAVTLFRRRPVAGGAFLMVVATGLLVGGFFVGSFALQHGSGYSAVRVGLLFLPVALGTIVGAQGAGHVLANVDTRTVAVGGLTLAAAGYTVSALWTTPAGIVIGLVLASCGIGATFVTAFTSSLADAGPEESGLRSAIVGTFHELGGALGVAVLATAAGTGLTAGSARLAAFTPAYTLGALAAAAAIPIAALLVPPVRRPAGDGPRH